MTRSASFLTSSGDVCGHGTGCAASSGSRSGLRDPQRARARSRRNAGSGELILAGLRYAVEQGFDVINMSLSTTKRRFAETLHELADDAYFRRTVLVAAAHNMPVESFPWRFSSVISVGSHEEDDRLGRGTRIPSPPVEFFARGVDVDVAWPGGGTMRCTGNSFASPHIAGFCALALAKHPELTAAAVEEPALPDRLEHRRSLMDESLLRAAVAAGTLGERRAAPRACCSRSLTSPARSSARRRRRSSCSTRTPRSSCSRPCRARARASSSGCGCRRATGIAGWVLVTRQPLADRRPGQRPAGSRAARQSARATCRTR